MNARTFRGELIVGHELQQFSRFMERAALVFGWRVLAFLDGADLAQPKTAPFALQPTVIEKAAGVVPASFTYCQFFGIDHFWLSV